MKIIKCRNFGDVSLSGDEQRLLFNVDSKEIAADITVAGTMTRILFTSINEVDVLPAVETATDKALYKTATAIHTKLRNEWVQIATTTDIDKAVDAAKAELKAITTNLSESISDLSTADTELAGRLNTVETDLESTNAAISATESRLVYNGTETIEDLFALVYEKDSELNSGIAQNTTDIETLKSKATALEGSISDLIEADNDLDERVTALESNGSTGTTPDEGTSVDLTEVWEAINDKVDAEYVAEAIKDKADQSALQELSTLIYDTETGIAAVNSRLTSAESALDDKADKSAITNMATTSYVDSAVENKADKSELFSGSYNDLSEKPTIPSIAGLATKESVDLLIEDVAELEERVTSLESSGPSGDTSNPPTEGLATVEYVDNAIKDLATKDDLVYEDNPGTNLQSMFMLVYDDTYGLEKLEQSVNQTIDELDSMDSKVTNLSEATETLSQSDADQTTKLTEHEARLQALESLNAVGITFGMITATGEFQALDLSGTDPAKVGDPVEASVYVYRTPAQGA